MPDDTRRNMGILKLTYQRGYTPHQLSFKSKSMGMCRPSPWQVHRFAGNMIMTFKTLVPCRVRICSEKIRENETRCRLLVG
jgi:hypothetical protein